MFVALVTAFNTHNILCTTPNTNTMKFFATTIALIGSSFIAIVMASKQEEVESNRNLAVR
jgi:hypothetical protein